MTKQEAGVCHPISDFLLLVWDVLVWFSQKENFRPSFWLMSGVDVWEGARCGL